MIRPLRSLERLSLDEKEGQVCCPQCGATIKIIAFITDFSVVDRIINHLKLTFVAAKPPPPHIAYPEVLKE